MKAVSTPLFSMSFPPTARIALLEMLDDVSDETLAVATIVVWALIAVLVPACFYLFRSSSKPVRNYVLQQHNAMTRMKREDFVLNPTISDNEAQRKRLQDELSKSQMGLRRSQEELVELRKDVSTKETDATSLQAISKSQQQNQVEEKDRSTRELKRQIDDTNSALKRSVEDVATAKEAASALEKINKQLEQKQRMAEGQAAKEKEVRAKLNNELEDLESENQDLREAKRAADRKVAQA